MSIAYQLRAQTCELLAFCVDSAHKKDVLKLAEGLALKFLDPEVRRYLDSFGRIATIIPRNSKKYLDTYNEMQTLKGSFGVRLVDHDVLSSDFQRDL